MAEWSHDWTDRQIEDLLHRFRVVYADAQKGARESLEKWGAEYDRQNEEWWGWLERGERTEDEYRAWLDEQAMNREWHESMIEQLTVDAVNADRKCMQMVADDIPRIFAENANFEAYTISRDVERNLNFTIYNEDTARLLIQERPDLVVIPEIDEVKDVIWNRRRFYSVLTQSIIQGDSIPDATERLMSVFGMDERSATRAARTAITGAESAGRQHSMERAVRMGVRLRKTWRANLDGRTRLAHRELDGETVDVSQSFTWGDVVAQRPADPTCPAWFTANCRCRLVSKVDDKTLPPITVMRTSKLPKDVSYDDWKAGAYRTGPDGSETKASMMDRGIEWQR